MTNYKTIKKAFERTEKAFTEKPSLAQKIGHVKVCCKDGLTCEVEAGSFKFKADMPKAVGGTESAPTPGMYEAAALGSCVTIMAKMWAVKMDVPLNAIQVDVEFDMDKRFLFGIGGVPAHWSAIRYHISVESTAPEEEVMHVLDKAHNHSHVRGDFEHSFEIERKISIIKSNFDRVSNSVKVDK